MLFGVSVWLVWCSVCGVCYVFLFDVCFGV